MEDLNLHLNTGSSVDVKVHPVVVFSILDHFIRRPEGGERVIGTLLGVIDDDVIEVKNCFPVPHTEGEMCGIDSVFQDNMAELHRKVAPKEVIVGWYATSLEFNEASVFLHNYYTERVASRLGGQRIGNQSIIHLLVDTAISNNEMNVKAYTGSNVALTSQENTLGMKFFPVPVSITSTQPETIGLQQMLRARSNDKTLHTSDIASVHRSITRLLDIINQLKTYVDKVLKGEQKPNAQIGRFLADAVSSLPSFEPDTFETMFHNAQQDLLMVVHLSNLARTHLALAEKLNKLV